jgi:hypothetical protein
VNEFIGRSSLPRPTRQPASPVAQCIGGEPGRKSAQRGVEVDGEIGVGADDPAVVAGPAGGEGGPTDRERVQRISWLAGALRDELADHPRSGSQPCRAAGPGGANIIAVDLGAQVDSVPYPMATPDDLAETIKEVEALDRRPASWRVMISP